MSGGTGTWHLVSGSKCFTQQSGFLAQDCAYNTTGTGGTTPTITVNLTGTPTNSWFVDFVEVYRRPATVDRSTTSSRAPPQVAGLCIGPSFTLTGTDAVIYLGLNWNSTQVPPFNYSSYPPFLTSVNGYAFYLNAPPGTLTGPTETQSPSAQQTWSGVAPTCTAGTFTPPTPKFQACQYD